MPLVVGMLLGAGLGGLLGFGLSFARVCSTTSCTTRPNRILSILAGVILGLSVAWYLLTGE